MRDVEIFIAYSHHDEDLCKQLVEHLAPLVRSSKVTIWHDREIKPGQDWEREIDEHIRSAQIIVPLISASFFASDYCWGVESHIALERQRDGQATIVPVVLRSCLWSLTPLAAFQALPKDALAVTSWPNRDEALTDVAKGLLQAIEDAASWTAPQGTMVSRGVGQVAATGIGRFPANVEPILRNVRRAEAARIVATKEFVLDGVVGPVDNPTAFTIAVDAGLLSVSPTLSLTQVGKRFLIALDSDGALRQQRLNFGRSGPPGNVEPDDALPLFPIHVVSCADRGQTGEVLRQWPEYEMLAVSEAIASKLSLYRSSGLQALAPKNWSGIGWFGSSGSRLTVQRTLARPIDTETVDSAEFVVLRYFSGNTSGREGVFRFGAPVFESVRAGLPEFIRRWPGTAGDYGVDPWPADHVTLVSALAAEFTTPGNAAGLGTVASGATPNMLPVRGVLLLSPMHREPPDIADLTLIAARLSPEHERLLPAILGHFKNS